MGLSKIMGRMTVKNMLILIFALSSSLLAQTTVNWWVNDNSAGVGIRGSIFCRASIAQTAIGPSSRVPIALGAGYLYSECETPIPVLVEGIVEVPYTFGINNIYPNPFNPSTSIEFEIPELSEISIDVYNLLGRKVDNLIHQENMKPGVYRLQWNGENLHSGLYFFRMTAGEHIRTKHVLLIK